MQGFKGRMTEPPAYLFSKTILSKSRETKINRSTKLAPGLPPNLISRLSQELQHFRLSPRPVRPGPVSSAPSVSVKRYLGNHKQTRKKKMTDPCNFSKIAQLLRQSVRLARDYSTRL